MRLNQLDKTYSQLGIENGAQRGWIPDREHDG